MSLHCVNNSGSSSNNDAFRVRNFIIIFGFVIFGWIFTWLACTHRAYIKALFLFTIYFPFNWIENAFCVNGWRWDSPRLAHGGLAIWSLWCECGCLCVCLRVVSVICLRCTHDKYMCTIWTWMTKKDVCTKAIGPINEMSIRRTHSTIQWPNKYAPLSIHQAIGIFFSWQIPNWFWLIRTLWPIENFEFFSFFLSFSNPFFKSLFNLFSVNTKKKKRTYPSKSHLKSTFIINSNDDKKCEAFGLWKVNKNVPLHSVEHFVQIYSDFPLKRRRKCNINLNKIDLKWLPVTFIGSILYVVLTSTCSTTHQP